MEQKYTTEQIAEMRKMYDIPDHFFPVAVAPGVIAWGKPLKDQLQTKGEK